MHVLEKILKEIEKLEKEHPYKVIGAPDTYGSYNEAWQDCLDRVEGIIRSYMEDDGWIPVEERLPEDDTDLEVTLADGARHIAWLGNKGSWYDSLCGYNGEKVDVIAWKEASAPYQPKEEKR